MAIAHSEPDAPAKHDKPFRRAVWRGLGVVLPPLLTIVILFWIGNTVKQYAYEPVKLAARELIYLRVADIRRNLPDDDPVTAQTVFNNVVYTRVDGNYFVPAEVEELVRQNRNGRAMPDTPQDLYRRYVEIRYLKPYLFIPAFLSVFILLLYLLGKFMAIGVGHFFVRLFEKFIDRLPLIRNVYSSVKQVTDLMFSEHEIQYTRIVAVEFPCKGIWSIGFVTGESMLDIRAAANEPVVAVLIPYSPLPVTGATITVRKSETIDLNITVDQAFQFVVSCGVVVPPHQLMQRTDRSLPAASGANGAQRDALKKTPDASNEARQKETTGG
jgi:uncharacterized membrane protein